MQRLKIMLWNVVLLCILNRSRCSLALVMLDKLTWNKENGCIKANFNLLLKFHDIVKMNFNRIIAYYLYLLQLPIYISHNTYDLPHRSISVSQTITFKPSFVKIGHLFQRFTPTRRHKRRLTRTHKRSLFLLRKKNSLSVKSSVENQSLPRFTRHWNAARILNALWT